MVKKILNIHLPKELWEWLMENKKKTGTTAVEVIRSLLREHIKKQDQESE